VVLKRYTQEARHPAQFSFYLLIAGSGQPLFLILELDATAGGCPHPAASLPSRSSITLTRSPAPAGRQVRLCPSKAERWIGRYGSRPSGGAL